MISADRAAGLTLTGSGMCRCDACGAEITFSWPAIVGHRKSKQHREAEAKKDVDLRADER